MASIPMDTIIFSQVGNSWKKIASDECNDSEIGKLSEVGQVKGDWKCHLCMYNDYNSGVNMFKLINRNKGRFKIVCAQCAQSGDMISFLFSGAAHKFLVNYNTKNGEMHN